MIFVDTHSHLYDEAFDVDRAEAIQRAVDAGVTRILLPDIDASSRGRLATLAATNSRLFFPMCGLHPTSVKEGYEAELSQVHRMLQASQGNYVAVGEIGLDRYWDCTYYEQQYDALRCQMLWAEEAGLPVCLHIRKAYNEMFGMLRDLNRASYKGVMHCFGGSEVEAWRAIEAGFYLGIGGVATFKNATMAEVARTIPLNRLLLETDAPYLAPVPYRGKRNESAYIPVIAQRVAELRDISVAEVAEQTTLNAELLFNLK